METLEEAKDFIRFLYALVQEKNSREEIFSIKTALNGKFQLYVE